MGSGSVNVVVNNRRSKGRWKDHMLGNKEEKVTASTPTLPRNEITSSAAVARAIRDLRNEEETVAVTNFGNQHTAPAPPRLKNVPRTEIQSEA